jgi:hypothetical protein
MSLLRRLTATAAILVLLAGVTLSVVAAEISGRIASVSPEKNQITMAENFKHWTIEVTAGTRITLNDREAKLSELRPGDEASVVFDRDGRKLVASRVRCTRNKQ